MNMMKTRYMHEHVPEQMAGRGLEQMPEQTPEQAAGWGLEQGAGYMPEQGHEKTHEQGAKKAAGRRGAKKTHEKTPKKMPERGVRQPVVTVEMATTLSALDISELCDATEEAINAGGGFGWLAPPPRAVLEDYWRGVLLIPNYSLFLGKLDHVIAGSCQIIRPPKNNEAQAFACQLKTFFLAPWARGHGLAQALVTEAEEFARSAGHHVLNLDVRATQDRAIKAFEARGYQQFGTNPFYAIVGDNFVPGLYFTKMLQTLTPQKSAPKKLATKKSTSPKLAAKKSAPKMLQTRGKR